MKGTLTFHLGLAAVSEALILLIAHAMSQSMVQLWEWQNPGEPVSNGALNGLLLAKAGLIIPVILIFLAVASLAGRLTSLKTTLHCLGLSLALTSLITLTTVAELFGLFMPIIIVERPPSFLPVPAQEIDAEETQTTAE